MAKEKQINVINKHPKEFENMACKFFKGEEKGRFIGCWCTKYGSNVTILPVDCTHCLDKVEKI